jgi:hypothetical protein
MQRSAASTAGGAAGQESAALSAGTQAVLQSLTSPVEIRFYAVLDTATVPEAVTAFAGRVEALLAAYQREAGGRITLTHRRAPSDVSAAAADGMKPFNLDKGDVCYLGLTIVQGGRKESIPRLMPEWEQALESDLSRAIARVGSPTPPAAPAAAALPIDPAITAEVKRRIPNFATISLEEGTQMLRESAFNDLKAAVSEMQSQLQEAEQRVGRMQEAEKQAALKALQRLQAELAAKLRDAAANSSAQIEALRLLKEAAR